MVTLIETQARHTEQAFHQEQGRQEVSFTTNPVLDAVCDIIHEAPVDWDSLIRTFPYEKVPRDVTALHGIIAELHITRLLDALAQSRDFQRHCKPIELAGRESQNYFFVRDRNKRLIGVSKDDNHDIAEYDNIVVLGGLPTIIEVSTKKANRSTNGINKKLRPKRRDHYFKPLQEYFGTNTFGYIRVTLESGISPSSPYQKNFLKNGGRLVAMNASRLELNELARAVDTSLQNTGNTSSPQRRS